MKTFYDLEKERQEEDIRALISNDMRVEGMIKSVVIGIVIILVYHFSYGVDILYKGTLCIY